MSNIPYVPQSHSIIERINNPVKLVQCIQACGEEEFIGLTLRSIYNEIDQIIVIEGAVKNRPNSTEDGHSIDKTVDIIKDFRDNHDPDKKVLFLQIKRPWNNLEEIKQTFLDLAPEGSIILINDADEFYMPDDIRRIRQAFDLQPHMTELIPTFLHFYRDFAHIAVPGPEWNTQHQRIFKLQRGMKYHSHPVVTDAHGHCTYFSPHYQHRRFVPTKPVYIYHYGYARNNMDEVMRQKQEYYEKELAAHGDASKKFDQKIKDWFDGTEPLLVFDGEHPDIIKEHPMFEQTLINNRNAQKLYPLWSTDEFYSKAINGEAVGNIWLCQTGRSQPYIGFYHNRLEV